MARHDNNTMDETTRFAWGHTLFIMQKMHENTQRVYLESPDIETFAPIAQKFRWEHRTLWKKLQEYDVVERKEINGPSQYLRQSPDPEICSIGYSQSPAWAEVETYNWRLAIELSAKDTQDPFMPMRLTSTRHTTFMGTTAIGISKGC